MPAGSRRRGRAHTADARLAKQPAFPCLMDFAISWHLLDQVRASQFALHASPWDLVT